MNREEAIKYSLKLEETLYPFDKKSLKMIVNKIYDDFESRTCESCKYISADKNKCNANNSAIVWLDIETFSDFGCNQWKRI